jgi:hypothetical protein
MEHTNERVFTLNRKQAGGEKDVEKGTSKPDAKNQPVKFRIADDDEDGADETTMLSAKPPPYILIESPSATKISGEGSPTHV